MDPNPKNFPLLSYVLARLNSIRSPNPSFDVEQPRSPPPCPPQHVELMQRMPHLDRPELLASMSSAVSDVAQTRSVLRTLGDRPDHESVDFARARMGEVDAELSRELQDLVTSPRPEGKDVGEWRAVMAEREADLRRKAEREKQGLKAVVGLDEMHEAYQALLKEAEERLVGIYGERVKGEDGGGEQEEDMMNEDVVKLLSDAAAGSITMVDLSGKKLRILPDDFARLRSLVVLNLPGNQLEMIPDSIAGLENLEELHLSSNLLAFLPDSIGLLLNLKNLDVSGNKLKKLPDSISHCRSLIELNVSYNELYYLPTNIGLELVNLQKLMVHLNKLRSLPTSICEMRCLRHLDAHFNELHGLPHAIGKLINLEIIDLSSNFSDLTELPETFGDLINLRELDLSNNQIHALPDTFGRLVSLIKLNVDQNPIVIPPAEIVAKGVQAVKEYMADRFAAIIEEEELKRAAEAEAESRTGWLSRSSSWLSHWVTEASGTVSDYVGAGQKSTNRDPILDQQL